MSETTPTAPLTADEIAAIQAEWVTYAGPLEPAIKHVRALLAEVSWLHEYIGRLHAHRDAVIADNEAYIEELRQKNDALRKVLDDVQEFVVLHFFDMRCGRETYEYIEQRLKEDSGGH